MNEARFRPEVEVRVGREAIGAESDTNAAGQEFAERMRGMAESGVGARAVDHTGVGWYRGGKVKEITVDDERRLVRSDSAALPGPSRG